jgi:hypothetical protein
MLVWFLENFQKVDSKKPLKAKDVCSMWKDSDLYHNLGKAEKRKNNYTRFVESNIRENLELRKSLVDRYMYEGKEYSTALIGWKVKTEC